MNLILGKILSMSLSGMLLILMLLLGGRLWKKKLGRQWQYYIWLVVILRLVLPFGPEVSLMGRAYQAAERVMIQMTETTRKVHQTGESSAEIQEEGLEDNGSVYGNESAAVSDLQEPESSLIDQEAHWKDGAFLANDSVAAKAADIAGTYLWIVWLAAALGILIRKITAYQSYIRFVTAGAGPVSDTAFLDQLAVTAQEMGIGRPIELCVNPLVASPMLVGYFHPCIVLPRADISEKEFQYITLHELTHYRRRDIWYKWLVQLAVCLHWFNPLVYVMRREIEKACEFACDEAVLRRTGYDQAKDYGETLLGAMAAVGKFREPFAAVTMSANKELLKERLGAIMSCGKRTKRARIITAALTVCVVWGAVYIGVFPTVAAEPDGAKVQSEKAEMSNPGKIKTAEQTNKISDGEAAFSASDKTKEVDDRGKITAQGKTNDVIMKNGEKEKEIPESNEQISGKETAVAKVEDLEKYYKGRSLPMFHIAFGQLDEKEQEAWLNRIYADGEIAFFSAAVWQLNADSPLMQSFAEKFYEDDDIAFFSVLADEMEEAVLEKWLDRALADEKWKFQSVLYDELGMDEELDALEKAMEEELQAQYRSVGVTQNGKNYYYEGQLVNLFLDLHMPNRSSYTLSMNPAGKINIKTVRSQDGKITGVAYMTEAEVEELMGDISP